MKNLVIILLFIAALKNTYSQVDTITIPPTKIILKSNVLNYIPNYAFQYGKANIGFEYYAGKDISVGLVGGTYFLFNTKGYPYKNMVNPNSKMTDVFGGFFQIEFKRFLQIKERKKWTYIPFPISQIQMRNNEKENTGYYIGLNISEEFITVFFDNSFGQSIIKKSKNYFSINIDLTLGYQSISTKGWVIDQTFGLGITKGSVLNESVVEYNLFKNISSDFYPNISYAIKFGREFVREFSVKEK
jgi:hypothetical protein